MADIKIKVPSVKKWVRIILADGRTGNVTSRIEMVGRMDIPSTVYEGKVYSNWHFDELVAPIRGVACDVQSDGCSLVFPIMDDFDAIDKATKKPVSIDELRMLFMKYEPSLELMLKK